MLKLGIIGYGVRTSYVWQGTMRPIGGVELVAIADPKWEKIKKEKGDELPNCHITRRRRRCLKTKSWTA